MESSVITMIGIPANRQPEVKALVSSIRRKLNHHQVVLHFAWLHHMALNASIMMPNRAVKLLLQQMLYAQ